MDVVHPEIKRLIWWWAWKVSRSCETLDTKDVAQELWVEAIISAQTWDQSKHAALTTYLFPKIRWRALKTLHRHMRLVEVENVYAAASQSLGSSTVAPQRETVCTIVSRMKTKLQATRGKFKSTALKVFDVMTDPPIELFQAAEKLANKERVDLVGKSDTVGPIKDFHIAYFLGVSPMTVSRSIRQIREVLEAEVHSGQKERKNVSH